MPEKPKTTDWKVKYDGEWYPVADVEDQGMGKGNLFVLEDGRKIKPDELEDLQIAASTDTFIVRVTKRILGFSQN